MNEYYYSSSISNSHGGYISFGRGTGSLLFLNILTISLEVGETTDASFFFLAPLINYPNFYTKFLRNTAFDEFCIVV